MLDTPVDWFAPVALWYLITLLLTIGYLPVTFWLFRNLDDRGACFARPVALLLVTWPVWFISGMTGGARIWTAWALWIVFVLGSAAAWFLYLRSYRLSREIVQHVVLVEGAFLLAFIAFLWFRGYGPAANWQEKPSDLMMLSSVMHSTSIPPQDAWLSGHSINYYYIGYALHGAIGKMTGLAPALVFNLALITTFAMTAVGLLGLVANVLIRYYGRVAALAGGTVATILALVMGNPWSTWKVWTDSAGTSFFDGIGWRASRVWRDSIDPNFGYNPITEFPAFSFTLGDLHPHVLTLPYAIVALGLAWMLITLGQLPEGRSLLRVHGARIAVAGAIIGGLYAMNSWDYPTFLLIGLLALVLGTVGPPLQARLIAIAMYLLASVIAWIPFHAHFRAPTQPIDSGISRALGNIPVIGGVLESIGAYSLIHTSAIAFLSVFGFLYAIFIALLIVEVVRRRQGPPQRRHRDGLEPWRPDTTTLYLALAGGLICFLGAVVVPVPLLILCGLPIIVTALMLERDLRLIPANIALMLFAFALVLMLVPEFFYISDIYTGSRMNTVFKVTWQVWLLMSVAGGIAIIAIWKALRWNVIGRYGFPLVVVGMMVAGLAYPIVGGGQWLDWRSPNRTWQGINGLAYLKTDDSGRYAGEYDAIQYLLDHGSPDDVILAAGGGEWDYAVGRISSATGIPSVLGWYGHESQWHLGDTTVINDLSQRVTDIDALYAGPPSPELINRYGITLIYMGPTETGGAPIATSQPGRMSQTPVATAGDANYPGPGWTEVFNQDDVRIWRREGT